MDKTFTFKQLQNVWVNSCAGVITLLTTYNYFASLIRDRFKSRFYWKNNLALQQIKFSLRKNIADARKVRFVQVVPDVARTN